MTMEGTDLLFTNLQRRSEKHLSYDRQFIKWKYQTEFYFKYLSSNSNFNQSCIVIIEHGFSKWLSYSSSVRQV